MPSPMLTPSAVKRRGPVLRQLSLQGTAPPLATAGNRRGLRRQLSDDTNDKPDLSLRIGPEGPVKGTEKGLEKSSMVRAPSRPKPVRLAWADRRQDSVESVPGEGVEVVARRCAGLPRPTSRTSRTTNLALPDKDGLLLTRQQLAERLRRAWRDRERKPNLDIFLAHSRPESAVSARSEGTDAEINVKKTTPKPVRAIHFPMTTDVLQDDMENPLQERNKIEIDLGAEKTDDSNPSALAELLDFKMFPVADSSTKFSSNFGSKQFQMRSLSFTKQCSFNKENVDLGEDNGSTASDPPPMTASERRASFKSSQLLNKTITGSFSDEPQKDPGNSNFKIFLTNTPARPPLIRTSSAPTQRTSRPSSPASPKNVNKATKPNIQDRKSMTGSVTKMDVGGGQEEDSEQNRDRSVASRRKLKTTIARRKNKEREESSDEEERIDTGVKKPPRRRQLPRGSVGSDIITMVSLVSPAESDMEEPPVPVLPSNTGKTADEPLETSPVEPEKEIHTAFILQKCVALRKSTKTVSFQAHPPVSRSCSASFPLRRMPPGAPIIIPTPNVSPPILSPQIHDKANGQDNRGVKRRLVRSRTTPVKEDEENVSSDDTCRTDTSTEPVSDPARPRAQDVSKDNQVEDEADPTGMEPEIKSPKEKECWALYKRMVDKGVAVSYETVLRGMLTPTEYRLRKNQLSRC